MASASTVESERPPLHGRLPGLAGRIIGREREIETIVRLLDTGDCRVVTLIGPGGIGKTRLAIAATAQAAEDYADGGVFIPFASVATADAVPATVAAALGIDAYGDRPVDAALIETLRGRHQLLLLDNLEHLIDDIAPWVADLLAQCPRVRIVATSRVPLRVAGEQRYPVEPLSLPLAEVASGTGDSAATRLFVERALAIRPDLRLTDAATADIVAICRALDGVPLAIELAAARVASGSLSSLRERLATRLGVLTAGPRDAAPRHRTMRDAIAWSHDLLGEPERRLFRRLSVFRGGFTVDGAEAVAGPGAGEALETLVEHSLVRLRPGDDPEDRYALLEVIREYGLEQLTAAGEADVARDAHAGYVRRLVLSLRERVSAAEPSARAAVETAMLDRLEQERDNLRAAIGWLERQRRIEEALALAVAIWPFRHSRGHDLEARRTLERLLHRGGRQVDPIVRSDALHALASFARSQGDHDATTAALQEARTLLREVGDIARLGRVEHALGWLAIDLGDLDAAAAHLAAASRIACDADDQLLAVDVGHLLGLLHLFRNEDAIARSHLEDGLRRSEAVGYLTGRATALMFLANLDLRAGHESGAEDRLQTAIALATTGGDRHMLPSALLLLADIARRQGDIGRAEDTMQQGLAIARETGYAHGAAVALGVLGGFAIARGDPELALSRLRESLEGFGRLGLVFGTNFNAAGCFDTLAYLAMQAGHAEQAARFSGMAAALLDRSGVKRGLDLPQAEPAWLDTVRTAIAAGSLEPAREAGYALDEDAMLAEALAFELPDQAHAEPPAPDHGLSPRELEVLALLADGLTNQEIADVLFVSARTISSHVDHIMAKLEARSRTAAVAQAIRAGIV